jgi:hypothetical protein
MLRLICAVLLLIFNHGALAWEDHAILTKTVLDLWSKEDVSAAQYLNQTVKAETLESFLEATRLTLPNKLSEIESWARRNEKGYKFVPDELMYQPLHINCSSDLTTCFQKAIRINQDVPLPLIVYDPANRYSHLRGYGDITNARRLLPPYIPVTFNVKNFTHIPANGQVKRADVISTASMQPDFGFDTFLYENSESTFGKNYGFGTQPLGDAAHPFHSQMLFHMSAYHEDPRILAVVPRLNENYPEYRAFLYLNLSRFAAENNHPYWAAVFLGWGLHYIQDLTQPYHTRLSYGLDTNSVLLAFAEMANNNLLPMMELQTIQVNRHMVLENLAEVVATSSGENGYYRKILAAAMSNRQFDNDTPPCDISSFYMREQISADPADYQSVLQSTVPSFYINSTKFRADSMRNFKDLFFIEMTKSQRLQFTEAMALALGRYGAYTRACVSYYR